MNAYVSAGYGITLVTLAFYALRLVRRGRSLSRSLPESRPGSSPEPS